MGPDYFLFYLWEQRLWFLWKSTVHSISRRRRHIKYDWLGLGRIWLAAAASWRRLRWLPIARVTDFEPAVVLPPGVLFPDLGPRIESRLQKWHFENRIITKQCCERSEQNIFLVCIPTWDILSYVSCESNQQKLSNKFVGGKKAVWVSCPLGTFLATYLVKCRSRSFVLSVQQIVPSNRSSVWLRHE